MLHKVEPPRPKAVYWYIDSLQLWLTKPLSSGQFRSLRSKCGSVHVWNGPAPWPSSYVQRLQLGQPSLEALQFLSGIIRDAHLNAVEIALDWVFEDEEALDDAFEFACRHHVKHHHRDQGVRFYPGKKGRTRYSGPRNAPNVLAIYADRPCRITGEFHCLHFDWRIKGSAALRREGISSVRDLLGFNHGRFWVKRLLMRDVDAAHLGRLLNNVAKGTKRRHPWIEEFRCKNGNFKYYYDRRLGGIIKRIYSSKRELGGHYSPWPR